MQEGLLWFDDDPTRSLKAKVARAAERYQLKCSQFATVCYVHPTMMEEGKTEVRAGNVRVLPMRTVLPHHFWIGSANETQRRHRHPVEGVDSQ